MNKVVENFLAGYSIEVTQRVVSNIDNFSDILPKGTLVYIAYIEGTPIEDMVKTSRELKENGFKKAPTRVLPNFLLGLLALFLKDIALFKDRLGKSQVTKADKAKKLLLWKPNFVEKAIIGTAKQYRETRKL